MAGRPTKLDDLTSKRICDALKGGLSRRAAAAVARVDDQTLCDWMKRGRTGEEPYSGFRVRVLEAEAAPEVEAVDCIMNAVRKGDWKAADTWLSKRRAIDWAAKAQAIPDEREDATQFDDAAMESVFAAWQSRRAG